MITLLRKIRRSLIESGSARKYLLYAIGEIALVVIGILIALQINNWNENRIKQRSLNNHLESLARAIQNDIRELSISIEFNEFRYHSWQYMLEMSDIPFDSLPDMPRPETFIEDEVWEKAYPDSINNDFINIVMRLLDNAFLGMIFNKSAINEINNLGILSDLNNDSLKTLINEYYYYLEWRFGEQGVNKRYGIAEDLKNYLRDEFALSSNYPPDASEIIEVIRGDKKMVIMIKDLIKESNDLYWVTWNLRNRAINLVEEINRKVL